MKANNRDLSEWLSRVHSGEVQLPRFQRFEAWGSREVADLMQTVIDRLPAGAVLVLDVGNNSPFHHRPLEGAPDPVERMTELLLDGQQRLTAVYRALAADYPDRTYFVDIRDIDDDEDGFRDYRVIPQPRWMRKEQRFPLWCDDPVQLLSRGMIPLALLLPRDTVSWAAWIAIATGGEAAAQLDLQRVVLELRERVSHFNLPYLALPTDSPQAAILNVFVKLNTSSVRLTAFDITVARVEEETGESLHDLVASLDGQVPELTRYQAAGDLVLPAACLMQGRRPAEREFAFLDFERMIADWPRLVLGARRTVELLGSEGVLDGERLPTAVVLAPLVALWAQAPDRPDALGATRTLLKTYLWRAFVTDRYESSATGAAFQDYQALLVSIAGGDTSASEAGVMSLPLPPPEELLAAGWPKRRDRLARAILCVSFRKGAHDIADGTPVSALNVRSREYHHLYPVHFLEKQEIDETSASRALNCALITWRTNRVISDKPPVEYLKDRTDAAALGEAEIKQRVATHAIDFDDLASLDYARFLERRSETVSDAFATLCAGADWPSS